MASSDRVYVVCASSSKLCIVWREYYCARRRRGKAAHHKDVRCTASRNSRYTSRGLSIFVCGAFLLYFLGGAIVMANFVAHSEIYLFGGVFWQLLLAVHYFLAQFVFDLFRSGAFVCIMGASILAARFSKHMYTYILPFFFYHHNKRLQRQKRSTKIIPEKSPPHRIHSAQ